MRRLKHLAVDRDCTLQTPTAEALNLVFERYEEPIGSEPHIGLRFTPEPYLPKDYRPADR